MVDKLPPPTIRVTCDSCMMTFEIQKSNRPDTYPCPVCKINGVLKYATD